MSRISLNAAATWVRSLLALALGFFASRWLLIVLGTDGYGLWVLLCGMTALSALAHGVVSSATARFMAFAAGRGDMEGWYAAAVKVHLLLAVATVAAGFPVCALMLGHGLSAATRDAACARTVLAILFLKGFAGMANSPNRQLFTAHQRMVELAFWNGIEAVANFVILWWMVSCPGGGMAMYAAALTAAALFAEGGIFIRSRCLFGAFRVWNADSRRRIAEIFRFSGWRFVSDGGTMLGSQGLVVMLHSFLGPAMTAAAGIARSAGNHCASLSEALAQAYEPALANAAGASCGVSAMAFRACARLVASYCILAVPIALFIDPLLGIWLKEVPPQTAKAVLWVLAIGVLDAAGRPFYSAVTAAGKVKSLYLGVGMLHAFALPLAFVFWLCMPSQGIGTFFAGAFAAHAVSLLWTFREFRKMGRTVCV